MITNRNVFFRLSIVINLAVLMYLALYLSSPTTVEEWAQGALSAEETELLRFRPDDTSSPDSSPSARTLDENTPQKTPSTQPVTNKTTSTMSILDLDKKNLQNEKDEINLDQVDQNALSEATLSRLRTLLMCNDKDFQPVNEQRGDFWVLRNYVRADHGTVYCHESVTYTTHAGYEFLDNVEPLVKRWMAPVSLAIHAPGSDFGPTIDSIRYLRDCSNDGLVREYVTFHIFFSYKHIPSKIPDPDTFIQTSYNCSLSPPFKNVNSAATYMKKKNMLYPVNTARNVARDAALTHFVLPSDIELYPSPNLVPQFLNMIARNAYPLTSNKPRIFPISIFEIDAKYKVPSSKTELKAMLAKKTAIPFHKFVCPNCHNIPQGLQWMNAKETSQMDIFHVGKRRGKFVHWEPIFIGTHQDPHYDIRLSWDGKKDKMTQGYVLCVRDYDFMILNNAFLCHKPGIKKFVKNSKRDAIVTKQNSFVTKVIMPELRKLYGTRAGCAV